MAGAKNAKLLWIDEEGIKKRRSEQCLSMPPRPLSEVSMNSDRGKAGAQPKLKDLCVEDKLRVKLLIEDLARAGTENEVMKEQLEKERRKFSGKLSALRQRQAALLREKKILEEKMKDSQSVLRELQEGSNLDKTPPSAESCQPPAAVASTHGQLPAPQTSQHDLRPVPEPNLAFVQERGTSLQSSSVANPNSMDFTGMKSQPVSSAAAFQHQAFGTCESSVPPRQGWCAADLPLARSCLARDGNHWSADSASSCSTATCTTWCTLPEASPSCFHVEASQVPVGKTALEQDKPPLTDVKLSSLPTCEVATMVRLDGEQASVIHVAKQEVGVQTLNVQSIATQTEQPLVNAATDDSCQGSCRLPSTNIPGQENLTAAASSVIDNSPTRKLCPQDTPTKPSLELTTSTDDEFEMVSALLNDSELQEELIAQVWDSSQLQRSCPSYQLYSEQDLRTLDLLSTDSDSDQEDTLLEDLFFIQ